METILFSIKYGGISHDGRTNTWNVLCKSCSKWFSPPTTIMATQTIECPKCQQQETINYNNVD